MKLGNNLRKLRFNHHEMTQAELAEAVNVSRQTIYCIETGRFNPSVLLALQISSVFGVPIEDVFHMEANDE